MTKTAVKKQALLRILDPDRLYTFGALAELTGWSRSFWERAAAEDRLQVIQGAPGRKGSTRRATGASAIDVLAGDY